MKLNDYALYRGDEFASGGPDGNLNEHAKVFLARTEYLQQQKANKSEIVQGIHEFDTYAEFDAYKVNLPLNCTVVIGEENNTGTGLWNIGNNRWNGTTLNKSAYDPLTQGKEYTDNKFEEQSEHFKNDEHSENDFEISHPDGSVSVKIKNGDIQAKSLEVGESKSQKVETVDLYVNGQKIGYKDDGYVIKAMTSSGVVNFSIDTQGDIQANNIVATKVTTLEKPKQKYVPYSYQWNFLACEGQSLGKGISASPIISSTQKYNDIMFAGGISLVSPVFTDAASKLSTVIPLVMSDLDPTTTSPYFLDGKACELPIQATTYFKPL